MIFEPFPKIARLSRDMIITEKLDGTNASVIIKKVEEPLFTAFSYFDDSPVFVSETENCTYVLHESDIYGIGAGSKKRLITPGKKTDNFGFAGWVRENAAELVKLGPGQHYGEWWGQGIQRGYGLKERRFSLFNVGRWVPHTWPVDPDGMKRVPACCHVVPVLYRGIFNTAVTMEALNKLRLNGSVAAPGWKDPEGIVVFHSGNGALFKKTFEGDEEGKERMAA